MQRLGRSITLFAALGVLSVRARPPKGRPSRDLSGDGRTGGGVGGGVVTTLLPDGASLNCGGPGYGEDFECESLYCNGDHCEASSTVPMGGTCDIFDSCEPGTHCDGTCKLDVDAGAACDSDAHCKAGLECLSTNVCGGAIGSACTEPEPGKLGDCALGKCVGGKCGYQPRLMLNVAYGFSLYAEVACKP